MLKIGAEVRYRDPSMRWRTGKLDARSDAFGKRAWRVNDHWFDADDLKAWQKAKS